MLPHYLEPGGPVEFPDPREADDEGLVAVGGDLAPDRLLAAYRAGIFPWYESGVPPLWWSPDPRGVLPVAQLHVSRRLERTLRSARWTLTWDRAFAAVMRSCAAPRADGTWIVPDMVAAYSELQQRQRAHSLEVWENGELVGGIYGVHIGGVFAAESKFHRRMDASKVALVALVRAIASAGVELVDVQFATRHLEQFGVVEWPRGDYLAAVEALRDKPVDLRAPLG